ncbi:hypothetical protein SCHPADRAFT_944111 [Schizopora paradoxa]|uniref:Uncharacterized protein n=1 Tax=Schizopora paradoxa TaxID=27342 RepID=A0A0H2RVI5_9AGAM|nr:hypothetical protein SCHPADRAFT_944111 [Schizopora paradoxa]
MDDLVSMFWSVRNTHYLSVSIVCLVAYEYAIRLDEEVCLQTCIGSIIIRSAYEYPHRFDTSGGAAFPLELY